LVFVALARVEIIRDIEFIKPIFHVQVGHADFHFTPCDIPIPFAVRVIWKMTAELPFENLPIAKIFFDAFKDSLPRHPLIAARIPIEKLVLDERLPALEGIVYLEPTTPYVLGAAHSFCFVHSSLL
jgi:hypothetical protein